METTRVEESGKHVAGPEAAVVIQCYITSTLLWGVPMDGKRRNW